MKIFLRCWAPLSWAQSSLNCDTICLCLVKLRLGVEEVVMIRVGNLDSFTCLTFQTFPAVPYHSEFEHRGITSSVWVELKEMFGEGIALISSKYCLLVFTGTMVAREGGLSIVIGHCELILTQCTCSYVHRSSPGMWTSLLSSFTQVTLWPETLSQISPDKLLLQRHSTLLDDLHPQVQPGSLLGHDLLYPLSQLTLGSCWEESYSICWAIPRSLRHQLLSDSGRAIKWSRPVKWSYASVCSVALSLVPNIIITLIMTSSPWFIDQNQDWLALNLITWIVCQLKIMDFVNQHLLSLTVLLRLKIESNKNSSRLLNVSPPLF